MVGWTRTDRLRSHCPDASIHGYERIAADRACDFVMTQFRRHSFNVKTACVSDVWTSSPMPSFGDIRLDSFVGLSAGTPPLVLQVTRSEAWACRIWKTAMKIFMLDLLDFCARFLTFNISFLLLRGIYLFGIGKNHYRISYVQMLDLRRRDNE